MGSPQRAAVARPVRERPYSTVAVSGNDEKVVSLAQRRRLRPDLSVPWLGATIGPIGTWAAKAGTNVVAKEDYLQTRAALEIEQRQAAQQQKLKEAQVQAQPAQEAPAAHQATPAQSTPQASPDAQEQAAPAEAPRRTRLSLMNFATPEDGIAQLHKEMSQLPAEQVKQRAEQAEGEHQAMGKGRTEEAATRVAALNAYHAQVQEVQQQERTQRQETPAQVETQRRTYQQ